MDVQQHSTAKSVQLGKATTTVMYNCGEGFVVVVVDDVTLVSCRVVRGAVLAGTEIVTKMLPSSQAVLTKRFVKC